MRQSLYCIYLGEKTGEKKACKTCTKSKLMVDVYSCKKLGECIPTNLVSGIQCCLLCNHRTTNGSAKIIDIPKKQRVFNTSKVDFFLTQSYIVDHWKPVYDILPEENKGKLIISKKELITLDKDINNPILVGSYGDLLIARTTNRPIIYTEHGIGCYYKNNLNSNSFCNGKDRRGVELFLTPNQYVQNVVRNNHPTIPSYLVGTPKMDYYLSLVKLPMHNPPIIGFTFAWNRGRMNTGKDTVYNRYIQEIKKIAKEYKTYAHSHPLAYVERVSTYKSMNVEVVSKLEDMFFKCDLLIADCTSAIFEFAALNKPVIFLNHPQYNFKDEPLPTRFFEEIGIMVDQPSRLLPAIEEGLKDSHSIAQKRMQIIRNLYPNKNATIRAVEVIKNYLVERNVSHAQQRDRILE